MLKRSYQGIPAPPGAGLVKIADPRQVLRGWLLGLAVALVVGAVTWPLGFGRWVDQARRQVVAIGYLQAAEAKAAATPVQREAALAALARAVDVAPPGTQLDDQAAQLYIGLRAYEQALPWLRRAARTSLLAKVSLGQSLLMTARVAEGDQVMLEVLRAARTARQTGQMPDSLYALLLNNIGYVHALAGRDLPQSRDLVQMAVRLRPTEPAFIDSLGWAEYRLGNYSEAAFYLERAVRLYLPQESAEMYYHLGAAYARLNRKHQARKCLERCLALDPSFEEAAQELQQLGQELPQPAVV